MTYQVTGTRIEVEHEDVEKKALSLAKEILRRDGEVHIVYEPERTGSNFGKSTSIEDLTWAANLAKKAKKWY